MSAAGVIRAQDHAMPGNLQPRKYGSRDLPGYMYSGQVAGAVFSRLEIPRHCVILCPNHTGRGHPLAMMKEGAWRTPLGEVPIDSELAEDLLQEFPALSEDSAAHRYEHAIEVELPFLQVRQPDM